MPNMPCVPGYRLLRLLGGGALTEVFSARDLATGKACVVKLLRADWETHPTAVTLIQREARAGLIVRHPLLVRVLRTHVKQAPYFLVLRIVPGLTARERLERKGPLEPATGIWVARQTAEALHAIHRAGFIHGDVKPENIRLAGHGTSTLMDLGFAHEPGELAALLERGCLLGSANYLAPELCSGRIEDGYAADVFSLGVTIYELLTGFLPYWPRSPENLSLRWRAPLLRELAIENPGLSDRLSRLIDGLLDSNPRARPRITAVVRNLVALEIASLRRRSA